jgi:hypothetical protein
MMNLLDLASCCGHGRLVDQLHRWSGLLAVVVVLLLLLSASTISSSSDSNINGVMRLMWQTPIQIVSLTGTSRNAPASAEALAGGGSIAPAVTSKLDISGLCASVFASFNTFRQDPSQVMKYRMKHKLHPDASDSDAYYFFQQDTTFRGGPQAW